MPDVILSYLKKGPRDAKEIMEALSISKKTFYKNISQLVEAGKVLELPLRQERGKGWSTLYALPEHHELAASISGFLPIGIGGGIGQRIRRAVEDLQIKLQRNPTVEEVILEINENPENPKLRDAAYQIGTKMGWRPPTPEEVKIAKGELQKVLSLASRMKKGTKKIEYVRPKERVKMAKEFLERFPELVP
jgi:DNA-binding transcriptional ArsR family regulator